jgi:DNA polymerase-4
MVHCFSVDSGEMIRSIAHVDMDAFYASVEQRDRPELRGRPVIVAGLGRRGVVSTASYEARRFGVRSALPTARARRLCPDGVFVEPRMAVYAAVSRQVFDVLHAVTPDVEGLSLDEAFLDVSACLALHGGLDAIGCRIKDGIRAATGLTCSVGLAHNKFLAKLASELAKPDGLLHLVPDRVQAMLDPLPVERLWTVGPVTARQLHAAGYATVRDPRGAAPGALERVVGNHAALLRRLAIGADERPVVPSREERSISAETTFEHDLASLAQARLWLMRLAERVGERARRHGLEGRTISAKLRAPPFETTHRQCSIETATAATEVIYAAAERLLERWWNERRRPRLRLLGVGLSGFEARATAAQGDLFTTVADEGARDRVLDSINRRFGRNTIRRARGLEPGAE